MRGRAVNSIAASLVCREATGRKNMARYFPLMIRRPRCGFTLIELLVVMGIISFLVALTVGTMGTLQARAEHRRTQALIDKIELALAEYKDRQGDYPEDIYHYDPAHWNGTNWVLPSGNFTEFRDSNEAVATILRALDEFSFSSNVARPAEIVEESGVCYVVDIWFRCVPTDHDHDLDVADDTYGFINIMAGGHNEPELDIWSNGENGENEYDPDDPAGHGDDVVNWGRR